MTEIFNRREQALKRRSLRAEAPPAERILWSRIRREACGAKFRRQFSVGPYVLDFYCPALRLAIEIDGPTHLNEEASEHDTARQQSIEALGVRFLRVTNEQVYQRLPEVVETICGVVREMKGNRLVCDQPSEVERSDPLCRSDPAQRAPAPLKRGEEIAARQKRDD